MVSASLSAAPAEMRGLGAADGGRLHQIDVPVERVVGRQQNLSATRCHCCVDGIETLGQETPGPTPRRGTVQLRI